MQASHIEPNPHNPRLLFDDEPMRILEESIEKLGILVPLDVYPKNSAKTDTRHDLFALLDGERRWMCAKKLKLKEVPVIVVEKPDETRNILTMFHIHNVREGWQLMPTALKLQHLIEITKEDNERSLAVLTKLTISTIRRCKSLLTYSNKHQNMMLAPPSERYKADFFIDLNRFRLPAKKNRLKPWTERGDARCVDIMIRKYDDGVIKAVTEFRDLASIYRDQWSDREVAERWGRLYPPRDKRRKPKPVTEDWIKQKVSDRKWIKKTRQRLANLGWFMKCLKEPLARMANKEDETRGAFWASRFKSIAILDNEALLATCAYIDLNPFAAGIAELPETSAHTSLKARLDHCKSQGRLPDLQAALQTTSTGAVRAKEDALKIEDGLWLCPFAGATQSSHGFPGMLDGFSLANYLQLLDETCRLVRDGKRHMSRLAASILERMGTTAEVWQTTITKMFSRDQLLGVVFSFSRDRLRSAARHRSCDHVANLNGCPA